MTFPQKEKLMEIYIKNEVFQEMYEYAHWANEHFRSEIAGWGHYSDDKGIYKLAPLQKQIVSGAEVEQFPNDILNDVKYDISDLVVRWHSHVNMSCNPSKQDENQIEEIMELWDFAINIIINLKGDYSAYVYYKKMGRFKINPFASEKIKLIPYFSNASKSKEVKERLQKYSPPLLPPSKHKNNNKDVFPAIDYYDDIYNDYYNGFETPPNVESGNLFDSTENAIRLEANNFYKERVNFIYYICQKFPELYKLIHSDPNPKLGTIFSDIKDNSIVTIKVKNDMNETQVKKDSLITFPYWYVWRKSKNLQNISRNEVEKFLRPAVDKI